MKSPLFSLFFSLGIIAFSSVAYSADLPNLHQISPAIYRGGRPSFKGLTTLKSNGVKAIINLENVAGPVKNEREFAKKLGLGYMSSPVSWIRPPRDEQVDKILAVMTNPKNQPVYIHCLHGRDRTGLISALYRVLIEKMSPRNAYREMKELGFRSFFVTLEYYFRERTNFWNLNYLNRPFPQDLNQEGLEGELHDDSDVFIEDPYDLTS